MLNFIKIWILIFFAATFVARTGICLADDSSSDKEISENSTKDKTAISAQTQKVEPKHKVKKEIAEEVKSDSTKNKSEISDCEPCKSKALNQTDFDEELKKRGVDPKDFQKVIEMAKKDQKHDFKEKGKEKIHDEDIDDDDDDKSSKRQAQRRNSRSAQQFNTFPLPGMISSYSPPVQQYNPMMPQYNPMMAQYNPMMTQYNPMMGMSPNLFGSYGFQSYNSPTMNYGMGNSPAMGMGIGVAGVNQGCGPFCGQPQPFNFPPAGMANNFGPMSSFSNYGNNSGLNIGFNLFGGTTSPIH